MEELAGEAEEAGVAVLGVAGDGMADGLEVDADLVGAAGVERDLEQREAWERFFDLEVRSGLARCVGVGGVLGADAAVAAPAQ